MSLLSPRSGHHGTRYMYSSPIIFKFKGFIKNFLFNALGNKISCFRKTSFFLGQSFEKHQWIMNKYVLQRSSLPLRGRNGNTYRITNETFFSYHIAIILSFIPKENNQWSGNILQEKDMQHVHFLSTNDTHSNLWRK